MIKNKITLKVADFDFAQEISNLSELGTAACTPLSMTPERINEEEYSFLSDIWYFEIISWKMQLNDC